jgi:hypothetical protein
MSENETATAIVADLLNLPRFCRAWEGMGEEERADFLSTLAEGIERRVDTRLREALLRISEQV